MSAIDDLLADLESGSSKSHPAPTSTTKKSDPLDDLLADIDPSSGKEQEPKKGGALDDLLADLDVKDSSVASQGDSQTKGDLIHAQMGADAAGSNVDDLLADLDTFDVGNTPVENSPKKVSGGTSAPVATLGEIETGVANAANALLKLSDLWADDDDIEVGASSAVEVEAEGEPCARCQIKFKRGEIALAMRNHEDKGAFHKHCFLCDKCDKPIPGAYAITPNKEVFCENCATGMCGKCGEKIDADAPYVTVQDTTLHKECYNCSGCKRSLEGEAWHGTPFKSFCRPCFIDRNAHKCGGCNQPILTGGVSIELGPYHRECVKCDSCGVDVGSGYFKANNRLFCRDHLPR